MYLRSRKRNLSLEIFILAMVDRGMATPYDLRERGALSIGATIPALARMEKEGLVTHTIVGRRHEFELTTSGRRRLKTDWQRDLDRHAPTDFDDILRTAYLNWLLSGPKQASRFLEAAGKTRSRVAAERKLEAQRLLSEFAASPNGTVYRWMKATAEAARSSTEAATLKTIRRELGRRSR